MTPNDDDFDTDLDADIGGDDGGHGMDGGGERASLKDVWDSNPLLKIAAVVVGIFVLGGAYFTLAGPAEEDQNKSTISVGDLSRTKVTPGAVEQDKEYTDAIIEQNKKNAEAALSTGVSALPTPVSTAKTGGIDVPEAPIKEEEDPLSVWRAQAQAAAAKMAQNVSVPEAAPPPPPEVVPMVQPLRPTAASTAAKLDPEMIKAVSQQMRVIVGAQKPEEPKQVAITKLDSDWTKFQKEQEAQLAAAKSAATPEAQAAASNAQREASKKTIVAAGSIAYAQLLNELNSDFEGPALAQILSGPFTGGRALGEFSTEGEYLVITFKRIIKDGVAYSINGIALDEGTTLSGHQSDINRHYFTRVILPAAAKFIEGYSAAVAETGTSTETTAGGGLASETPEPSAKESLYAGLEEAGKKAGEIFDQGAKRPVTVIVSKGTTMGILFMDTVTTLNAQK